MPHRLGFAVSFKVKMTTREISIKKTYQSSLSLLSGGSLFLQRFALKPKLRKFLKALLHNAFKNFPVVRLIGN
jgi:hypothetical protein